MSIYKRGSVWWMDVYMGGENRRVRKSTGCTDECQARIVEQAAVSINRGITSRQRAMAIIDAVLPEDMRGLKIEDAAANVDALITADGIVLSKMERSFRIGQIGHFAAWAKKNSRAKVIGDVNGDVAWSYSKYLGQQGISAKTRNKRVSALGWAWKQFMRHAKATENPWANARAQRNSDEESHGRAFTDRELARIMAAAKKVGHEWCGVITVALYTGLRMRDVECLRWTEVDMKKRMIHKAPSKTARRGITVSVPMHDKVFLVLSNAATTRDGEWVFPWRQSHPTKFRTERGDCHFADLLAMAGIVERDGERISFHCLRHTFVTRLSEAGVAQDVRMRLAGHTNAATSNAYTHDDVSARAAIDALD